MSGFRLPDWSVRLSGFVEARRDMPFTWGGNDCAAFVAGALETMSGRAFVAAFADLYRDERSAARALRDLGGMRAAVDAVLGTPGAPLLAQVGDIGLLPTGALVLCNGDTWIGPGPSGLTAAPLAAAVCAWRVGACQ